MRTIAVCDDNEQQLLHSSQALQRYANDAGFEVHLELFVDVEACIGEASRFDAVFMDIEFGGDPLGIEAVARINEAAPGCQIVYLTNYLHYSLDVYGTDHAWYVLKSQLNQRLPEIFQKLAFIDAARHASIVVNPIGVDGIVNITCNDICYLERDLRITRLALCDGSCYEVRNKLSDLQEKLPGISFGRCHNSYVVNFEHVRRIGSTDLDLDTGLTIPISRNYSKRFRTDYLLWAEARTV